jgi:tetratricopeptide (TPR) repeat protein
MAGPAVAQTSDSSAPSSDKKPATPAAEQDTASSYGLPAPLVPKSEMPPEEDKSNAPRVYTFNPVQSQHDVTIGDEYFKKGNYTAAASRYDEATKWNDGNAEAWLRLGEAQEKKSNAKAAREAYRKYLELVPDAKNAPEIKKRLSKLKG